MPPDTDGTQIIKRWQVFSIENYELGGIVTEKNDKKAKKFTALQLFNIE